MDFPTRYHGIDGLMMRGNRLVIVEAKGGAGTLGITKSGEQLSKQWIDKKILEMQANGAADWARKLRTAKDSGDLDVLLVRTPTDNINGIVPEFVLKDITSIGSRTFLP
jgi:hypothetical protein